MRVMLPIFSPKSATLAQLQLARRGGALVHSAYNYNIEYRKFGGKAYCEAL